MKKAIRLLKITLLLFSITGLPFVAIAITQKPAAGQKTSPPQLPAKNQAPTRTDNKTSINGAYKGEARDHETAALFAPVFYQAFDERRFDYLTNFDFDGDWRGDNNWANAARTEFPMRAYIYYSVSETPTHYFIHYAVFHPRDYKGGERRGMILSEVIREGAKIGVQYDPTGKLDEAVLAHENDMEGCLVIVEKRGTNLQQARVQFVETLAHNKFWKYTPDTNPTKGFNTIKLEGNRAKLYIEAKGHGIQAYRGDEKDILEKNFLIYSFTGQAENPEEKNQNIIGYDLLPLYNTLWARAQKMPNETFGEAQDYAAVKFSRSLRKNLTPAKPAQINKVGCAFLGKVGAANMARAPWGWFDSSERARPLGEWFFSPAATVKRHFKLGDAFSVAYMHNPYFSVFR
jgi:hypothetical protein